MAFEVFDDTAAFWFIQTILAVILLPWTISWMGGWLWHKCKRSYYLFKNKTLVHDIAAGTKACLCDTCEQKRQARDLEVNGSLLKRTFTWSNLIFMTLWLLYFYMILQIPTMAAKQMVSFDPYQILNVEKGATLIEIKRAYRTLSLTYHPDKNPDDQEAANMFMLVSKAHQALTDETTRMNYEKYGNPDGYQGTSVTIGLPSFLTDSRNEHLILIVYFAILFVALPVTVGIWWQNAKRFHESGVLQETIGLYFHKIVDNTSLKFLVQYVAAAAENRPLELVSDYNALRKIVVSLEANERIYHSKFNLPYIVHTNALLHAHMLRMKVPANLQKDVKQSLTHTVKLLDCIFEMNLSRNFLIPAFDALRLMQLITQGVWVNDDPLLQLPFLTEDDCKSIRRKADIKSLSDFQRVSAQTRAQLLSFLKPDELAEMEYAVSQIPVIDVDAVAQVQGEEGCYEGDTITVTVSLTPQKYENTLNVRVSNKKTGKENSKDNNNETKSAEDDSYEDPNSLDTILKNAPRNSRNSNGTTRQAYTPRFPFPKQERWFVIMSGSLPTMDGKHVERVLGMQKITSFAPNSEPTEVQMYLPPGLRAGVYPLTVRVICDSYIHLDEMKSIRLKIEPRPADLDTKNKKTKTVVKKVLRKRRAPAKATVEEIDDEELNEEDFIDPNSDEANDSDVEEVEVEETVEVNSDDEDEEAQAVEEEPAKWYYLYLANSWWEFLLCIFLLALLGIVIVHVLQSRGYWQKYVQPILDRAAVIAKPFLGKGTPVYNAVNAVYKFISNLGSAPEANIAPIPQK